MACGSSSWLRPQLFAVEAYFGLGFVANERLRDSRVQLGSCSYRAAVNCQTANWSDCVLFLAHLGSLLCRLGPETRSSVQFLNKTSY